MMSVSAVRTYLIWISTTLRFYFQLKHAGFPFQNKLIKTVTPNNFKEIGTFSREATLSKLFCLLFEKGSTLKGKNLLPMGANSFLLEWTSFSEGAWCAGK